MLRDGTVDNYSLPESEAKSQSSYCQKQEDKQLL